MAMMKDVVDTLFVDVPPLLIGGVCGAVLLVRLKNACFCSSPASERSPFVLLTNGLVGVVLIPKCTHWFKTAAHRGSHHGHCVRVGRTCIRQRWHLLVSSCGLCLVFVLEV